MDKKEIVKSYLDTLNIDHQIKTLEDITKLIKAHIKTFCFSSLKVLLKEEISLELDNIYEDIVVKKIGGYCFEHNKLMYEVLKELGFDVTHCIARVVNNTDNMPPKTHRFTLLDFENERYIIDVGISFRTPSVPVKFGDTASTSHLGIKYSIKEFEDGTFAMQLTQKGKDFIATKFNLERCYESDFEMGHFYSHKHPKAMFVNNVAASRIEEDVIYSLVNNKYIKIYKDKNEEIELSSVDQFAQILKDDINLNLTFKEIEFIYNIIQNKAKN